MYRGRICEIEYNHSYGILTTRQFVFVLAEHLKSVVPSGPELVFVPGEGISIRMFNYLKSKQHDDTSNFNSIITMQSE